MSSLGTVTPINQTVINTTTTTSQLQPPNVGDALYVSGFTIDASIFILGSLIMIAMVLFLVLYIFGRPIFDAKNATNGLALIQHTDTPRSASFKLAKITGEGFRYKQVSDGTVAASPKAVYSVNGKNIALTYAQCGLTIPVNIMSAISILVTKGIKNIEDFNKKYEKIIKNKITDKEGNITEVMETKIEPEIIVSGYDFDDFNKLKLQTKEELMIPLTLESFSDFTTESITADLLEKDIIISEELEKNKEPDNGMMDVMKWVIAFLAIIIIGWMVVK